jgi:hypothetical protein
MQRLYLETIECQAVHCTACTARLLLLAAPTKHNVQFVLVQEETCAIMAPPPQLFRVLENLKDQAKDAIWAISSCLCQQTPKVKINGRTCRLFSFNERKSNDMAFLVQSK